MTDSAVLSSHENSSELYYAEMEAARNEVEHAYFAAQTPHLGPTAMDQKRFRDGFERAFQRLWRPRETPEDVAASRASVDGVIVFHLPPVIYGDGKVGMTRSHYAELVTLARQTARGWQPIATAPKDGRWILMGTHVSCYMGYWDHEWKDQRDSLRDPTHWMPLPRPPDESSGCWYCDHDVPFKGAGMHPAPDGSLQPCTALRKMRGCVHCWTSVFPVGPGDDQPCDYCGLPWSQRPRQTGESNGR